MTEELFGLNFVRALDEMLLKVLLESSASSILSERPHAITIGVFFCRMYRRYPDQVASFFENPARFNEVADKLAPEALGDDVLSSPRILADRMRERWESLRKNSLGEGRHLHSKALHGGAAALDVPLGSGLVKLFQATSNMAVAAGHQRADIRDLVKALSEDEGLVRELREETGLVLRSRPPTI